jgi:hypothetical protein
MGSKTEDTNFDVESKDVSPALTNEAAIVLKKIGLENQAPITEQENEKVRKRIE